MDLTYLYVSPEEYAEVKAAGACWDEAAKCWYIAEGMAASGFSRWLGEDEAAGFNISSEEAMVASARVGCSACRESMEVICLHCVSGVDDELGEAMAQMTVSNVWAVDCILAEQLRRWPCFRVAYGGEGFANHCPHCGAMQEDYLLHAEPGDVFFDIAPGRAEAVTFTALEGRIRVGGDYGVGM